MLTVGNSSQSFHPAMPIALRTAINRQAWFYQLCILYNVIKGHQGGFEGVDYDIVVADSSNATWVNERDDVPNSGQERTVQVNLPWAEMVDTIEETGRYRAASAGAQPRHSTTKRARALRQTIEGMVYLLEQSLISGTGATVNGKGTPYGIAYHLSDSNVIGNVDRSVEVNAGSSVLTDVALRDITHDLMHEMDDVLVNTNGGTYGPICTSPSIALAWAMLGESRHTREIRIDAPLSQRLTQVAGFGGRDPMVPYGYFKEHPVYGIPRWVANTVHGIDMSEFEIEQLSPIDLEAREVRGLITRDIFSWRGQTKHHNPRKGGVVLANVRPPAS